MLVIEIEINNSLSNRRSLARVDESLILYPVRDQHPRKQGSEFLTDIEVKYISFLFIFFIQILVVDPPYF